MSVNSYLKSLGSDLVLSSSEKESIAISVENIKSKINSYFDDVEDILVFGSYGRETILPRKADEKSDVDMMVIFKNPYKYKPQSFLNRLKIFVEAKYTRSEIHQSSPTIVLELNHIMFELTPAYVEYGLKYIPNGPSDWMYSNPTALASSIQECNKNNAYKIKPVVRLLKYWNVQKNYRDYKSYIIESKIADNMKYSYFSCTSYTDYLLEALRYINPYGLDSRANTLKSTIEEALKLEEDGYPYSAEAKIKEKFPTL